MNRRSLLRLGAAAAAAPIAVHLAQPVRANTASNVTQVIGVQNFRVGDWIVTALLDGAIPIGAESLANLTLEEAQSFAEAAFLDSTEVATGVNAYVLRKGEETILVDAGGAGVFPGLGGLSAALDAAGITPASITRILLTHLHPDHIGGLLVDGMPAFPGATAHVHAAEIAFWTDAGIRAQAPEGVQPFFDLAKAVVDAYSDQIDAFDGEIDLIDGIRVRVLPGHTPGHSGFEISDGDEALLIWGDIIHVAVYQFPKPSAAIGFDVDAATAIATREALLAEVSENRMPVAGMHLPFPGIGHVVADGGGFRFKPKPWSFSL